jgi:hypothetical protein
VITPLHVAAGENRFDVVDLLIREGFPVDAVDSNGEPPLFIAVRRRLLENVKRLATEQTVMIRSHKTQRTALHIAAEIGDIEIVEFLLGVATGQITKTDHQGNTPLHLATSAHKKELVGLLLEAGADLMVRNNARQSPYSLGVGSMRTVINKYVANHPECLQPAPIDRSVKKVTAPVKWSGEVTRVHSQGRQQNDLESLKTQISGEIQDVQQQIVSKVDDIKDLMEKLREDVACL